MTHWANDWQYTPYGDRGRGPSTYDCWGLVWAVYRDVFGIDVPAYDGAYSASVAGDEIEAVIDRECAAWLRVDEPAEGGVYQPPADPRRAREGDVVILRILGRRMHCGVALDGDQFLHLLHGACARVERMSDMLWHRRVAGIYRHRELA